MKNIVIIITIMVLSLTFITCSKDDLSFFQKNDLEPEFRLFNLLDDFPALKDAFNNLDQGRFNTLLSKSINSNISDAAMVLGRVKRLIGDDPGHSERPVTDILSNFRSVLYRINNQNDLDVDSIMKYPERSSDYTRDFYDLLTMIFKADLGISDNFLRMAKKTLGYIDARYGENEIDEIMSGLITFLRDNDGQTLSSVLEKSFSGLGKIFLQSNENIWLKSDSKIRTIRSSIDQLNDTDSGLGNGVRGLDSLLSGLNDLLKNGSFRNDLYGIFSELGDMSTLTMDSKKFHEILKDLICNLEDFCTDGGSIYSSIGTDYNIDTPEVYINAELGNSLKELFPALVGFFLRGNREDSIISDDGTCKYPLEIFAENLNGANINIDNLNFENTLNKMLLHDGRGRNRKSDPLASNVSYLDHLVFLLTAVNNFGYSDGGDTGEANHNHGHGAATGGILTLNDCLFNLTTGAILDSFNAYNLCLNHDAPGGPHGKYIQRSKSVFNEGSFGDPENDTDFGDYPFLMDSNYHALNLMSGECAGDAGVPDGGVGVGGDNGWNSYRAYSQDGKGETNTARWILGWIARVCWEGQGPFYSTEGATEDNGLYTYYSPDGKVYGKVDKKDSQWEYKECKFKKQWNTDHYMIEIYDEWSGGIKHYSPDNSVYLSEEKVMADTDVAGCLSVSEIDIPDEKRECATQEEAIYRNFQWLINEKRFVFVIPLRIDLFAGVGRGAVYAIVESNGVLGVANGRKYESTADSIDGNGRWLIDGGDGDSTIMGDARLTVLLGGAEGVVTDKLIYNDVLGSGYLLPDIICANFAPVSMLGFFTDEKVSSLNANMVNSVLWGKRNALLPVLVALIGGLHEHTSLEDGKYPLKVITDAILPVIAKPMFYFQKEGSLTLPDGCWKPRLNGGNNYLMPSVSLEQGDDRDCYYSPKGNPTAVTLLCEGSYKDCNGIIALLCRTKAITRILSLIKGIGKSSYDDDENYDKGNYSTWGARRRILYGIEQIISMIRTRKGEAIERGYIDFQYPSWLVYEDSEDIRPEDIMLGSIIDEIIGSDALDKGIAVFPDYRDPLHPKYKGYNWKNYTRLITSLGEILSSKGESGGKFNLMNDLTGMVDKVFTGIDAGFEEIRGLRHTIGSVFTGFRKSKGRWEYPGELIDILKNELPSILEVYQGNYRNLITLAMDLMKEEGFIEYLFKNLKSRYTVAEILDELHEFLGIDLISRYNSPLWSDLASLITDLADVMEGGGKDI